MSPRVSVVVPVYNVASYLDACLESLAVQTAGDLEVIMVDDGSTDESPAIAKRFAARDGRFRLVQQPNAGLGAARNTGLAHATGEFLAFVDSDDAVTANAYELLLAALDETGSDFASGNVLRLSALGTAPVPFLAPAFERTRLRTHITRFPGLRVDRTAWNKLFRRSFWDANGFRFPEGVLYEDTPVTLPAHYVARTVDVLREPVYFWRMREGGDLSITQRRTEPRALRDRVAAVDYVSRFLADRRMMVSKALYDRTVLRQDLRFFLAVLPNADEEYRQLFLDLVNDFLDRAHPSAINELFAIDRLKWHLVRRRALPELLDVIRFEIEELPDKVPLRSGRHWYGDYPYRDDPRLAIPNDVFRLKNELAPIMRVEELRWEGETLRISGYAYIDLLGAAEPGSQKLELTAKHLGWPPRRVRLRIDEVHRPDLTASRAQRLVSLDHAGFVARLDGAELKRDGAWQEGAWEVRVVLRAQGLVRRPERVERAALHPVPVAELIAGEGMLLRAEIRAGGDLRISVGPDRSVTPDVRLEDGILELEGELARPGAGRMALQVESGQITRSYPVHVDRSRRPAGFLARLPLAGLGDARVTFQLVNGRRRVPLTLSDAVVREIQNSGAPVLTDVSWTPEGRLRVAGLCSASRGEDELLVAGLGMAARYSAPLSHDAETSAFEAELTPAAMMSPGGSHPLAEGTYEVLLGAPGATREKAEPLGLSGGLLERLPISSAVGLKRIHVGVSEEGVPVLAVERDLVEEERGGFAQRRLRTSFYPEARSGALREAVLYESFGGREYSDNPRAVYEELVRRRTPLEHLWVVRDGAYRVPEGALAVRAQSRDYYEAYARVRYVVANDHWPRWCRRRPDQVWLQTWHGAPLKLQGRELEARPAAVKELRRALEQDPANWQYVISPGAFATSILEASFAPEGEILETGLPRTDLLVGAEREERAAEVKRRLGLGDETVVLYAPTYRDDLDYAIGHKPPLPRDRPTYHSDLAFRDGYRLGVMLDLAALAAGLGDGYTVLFHKHARVVDPTPVDVGRVRDVSGYPDGLELLLVADVLVTDYSSWLLDFAATGRPIVLFAPDLEKYRDHVRGLHIDLASEGPGPVVSTLDEVVEAVRDRAAVRAQFQERHEAFVATYCPLADGHASGRVVDRIFDA
jgi:CDP-glycerol glycerophosphotransferase